MYAPKTFSGADSNNGQWGEWSNKQSVFKQQSRWWKIKDAHGDQKISGDAEACIVRRPYIIIIGITDYDKPYERLRAIPKTLKIRSNYGYTNSNIHRIVFQ